MGKMATPTVCEQAKRGNRLPCPTPPEPGVDNIAENPRMSNPLSVREPAKNGRAARQALGPCGSKEKPARQRIDRTELAIRSARAEALADAIGRAHPDDARAVMTAALIDLHQGQGMPYPAIFGSIREDARFWAKMAGEVELFEVARECLEQIPNRALHLDHRKRLLAALFTSLPDDARQAFMSWAEKRGTDD